MSKLSTIKRYLFTNSQTTIILHRILKFEDLTEEEAFPTEKGSALKIYINTTKELHEWVIKVMPKMKKAIEGML